MPTKTLRPFVQLAYSIARRAPRLARTACAVLLTLGATAPTHAQSCQPGFIGSQAHLGVNGTVRAMCWWDSDGAGPLAARLIVAGNFTLAGEVRTNNIAAWDGSRWTALAQGVGTASESVSAVEVYQGQLYAAGALSTASGTAVRGIARFDGTSWNDVAGGLWLDPVGARVYALRVHDGSLYAGGLIAVAGSTGVRNIARFDGTSWSATDRGLDGAVYALHVHNGQLHAGGSFADSGDVFICPRVARWNGSNWESPTTSTTQLAISGAIVYALASHNNQLVAGGSFASLNNLIALSSGSWQALAGGATGGSSVSVRAMQSTGLRLVVSGNFESAGSLPAAGVAALDGTTWQNLGTGTDGSLLALATDPTNSQRIYAGGSFVDYLGGAAVGRLGLWDGARWSAVGVGFTDAVLAQGIFEGSAIVGGAFRHAGSTPANAIARWDGANWQALGEGIRSGTTPGQVRAIAPSNDGSTLTVGGSFSSAGSVAASNVAQWNGVGWVALGTGINAPVYAIANFGSDVIVGGAFTTAGGVPASRVARWNGSAWQAMGVGFAGIGSVSVQAFAVYNGDLYAGGNFATSGLTSVLGIAKWNAATNAWQPVAAGVVGGSVLSMTVHDGELVIGGSFSNVSGAGDTTALAKWNGSRWARVGPELAGAPAQVSALASTGDKLFVGGLLTFAGSRPLNNVACFSQNTGWVALGDGLAGLSTAASPRSMMAYQGEVLVGGEFVASTALASGALPAGSVVRAYWSRWSVAGTPWTTARVQSPVTPVCDQDVVLSARLATGYSLTPAQSWQWRRNGQPLAETARLQGTASPTLRIVAASESDSASYTCFATTQCGESSWAVPVVLQVSCGSGCDSLDFNNDQLFPDDNDLADFLRVLGGNQCSTCNDIDFNNDGLFPDDNDLLVFLRVLAGGPC